MRAYTASGWRRTAGYSCNSLETTQSVKAQKRLLGRRRNRSCVHMPPKGGDAGLPFGGDTETEAHISDPWEAAQDMMRTSAASVGDASLCTPLIWQMHRKIMRTQQLLGRRRRQSCYLCRLGGGDAPS